MKNIVETILDRRSVRRYERQPIEEEKKQLIYDAINSAPTSHNGQQFSVIAIEDQELKEKIYELTKQKQIKTCALFLVFCSDYHKLDVFAKSKGMELPPIHQTIDGICVGYVDAAIAMSNARVMAEGLGLGCCCIGYIRTAAPEELSQLLGLPQGVAIVCGLTIGYPRQIPDIRPKQEQALFIHHNRYSDEGMVERLEKYDHIIAQHNATHTLADYIKWSKQMEDYYHESMGKHTLAYLQSQGYGVDKERGLKE